MSDHSSSDQSSKNSIEEANRYQGNFSRHAESLGAAGFLSPYDDEQTGEFLTNPGDTAIINPTEEGMRDFEIGVAWDNVVTGDLPSPKAGFFEKLLGAKKQQAKSSQKRKQGVDLDIGCLYELRNGKRGAIQAFGEMFGSYGEEPYILLSGDERTGDSQGEDEFIKVNGAMWNTIERIVIYIYIYGGAKNWDVVKPQIQVRVPGEKPLVVTLKARREEMAVCAVVGLENIRGGIKMTNYMEYFPGHAEMDRAFGFGLEWDDGQK